MEKVPRRKDAAEQGVIVAARMPRRNGSRIFCCAAVLRLQSDFGFAAPHRGKS
jgi:hypothetical protein